VRAKADKAKEKIQVFLRDWKGRPEVSSDASYVAISGAAKFTPSYRFLSVVVAWL